MPLKCTVHIYYSSSSSSIATRENHVSKAAMVMNERKPGTELN